MRRRKARGIRELLLPDREFDRVVLLLPLAAEPVEQMAEQTCDPRLRGPAAEIECGLVAALALLAERAAEFREQRRIADHGIAQIAAPELPAGNLRDRLDRASGAGLEEEMHRGEFAGEHESENLPASVRHRDGGCRPAAADHRDEIGVVASMQDGAAWRKYLNLGSDRGETALAVGLRIAFGAEAWTSAGIAHDAALTGRKIKRLCRFGSRRPVCDGGLLSAAQGSPAKRFRPVGHRRS